MWAATLPLVAEKCPDDDTKVKVSAFHKAISVIGPGIMVCLADSDIGGLFTMALAGSQCGYALLPLQALLIPALYMAQELTIRLGICSRRSLVGLVYEHFGWWAGGVVLVACLGVCIGAVISEFSGVAAVGELWGLPRWASCSMSAAGLSALILCSSFSAIERLGLALGASLVVFLVLGAVCRPTAQELSGWLSMPTEQLERPVVRQLVAANIGTVVTPWMLFYQLSAVAEKRLTQKDLQLARLDTAVGAVSTQAIMAAVLVTYARLAPGSDMSNLPLHEALVMPLRPLLGDTAARTVMSCGLLGASLLATIVAALAVAWNCGDAAGTWMTGKDTWRYVFLGSVLAGALTVGFDLINIFTLNVFIQVMNAVALPVTVGALFMLARSEALPSTLRLQGGYAALTGVVFSICSAVGVACAFL
eukprot:CAMPEP_0170614904 /NCGR_PEP_ID=MMETSP0224-20130122/25052_1 /TAXON_ID=285029 /ORGANISM="Togula jolla, Strain CCCM 725" /LENGTH=419 /DNA_ID=CAMNT_0010940599 /DNA_START=104 /DNA_END=1363 /DNA_ORIENTATION=+